MQLGFIGLGHLGKAIAKRLANCGYTLTVWNRSTDKAHDLKATLAASPGQVVRKANIIGLCLFDSAAVHKVLTMQDGLFSTNLAGKILIDHTTNHFFLLFIVFLKIMVCNFFAAKYFIEYQEQLCLCKHFG